MRKVLTEAMSFRDLWVVSDPARKKRASHVKPKQMFSRSVEAPDSFVFSYKSDPGWSTTGQRWHGYVKLLKEGMVDNRAIEIQDVDCQVDCDCPDYRYRWAYNNAEQGAGETGAGTWNKNNGQAPKPKGPPHFGVGDMGPGLCKHLMSLVEFLGTKVEPVAPEPDDVSYRPKKVVKPAMRPAVPSTPSISTPSKVGAAPEPPKKPSYYSDTRSGDLLEGKGGLYEKISKFVKENPEFAIPYYDEE